MSQPDTDALRASRASGLHECVAVSAAHCLPPYLAERRRWRVRELLPPPQVFHRGEMFLRCMIVFILGCNFSLWAVDRVSFMSVVATFVMW